MCQSPQKSAWEIGWPALLLPRRKFTDCYDAINFLKKGIGQVVEGADDLIAEKTGGLLDASTDGIVVEVSQLFALSVPLDNTDGAFLLRCLLFNVLGVAQFLCRVENAVAGFLADG